MPRNMHRQGCKQQQVKTEQDPRKQPSQRAHSHKRTNPPGGKHTPSPNRRKMRRLYSAPAHRRYDELKRKANKPYLLYDPVCSRSPILHPWTNRLARFRKRHRPFRQPRSTFRTRSPWTRRVRTRMRTRTRTTRTGTGTEVSRRLAITWTDRHLACKWGWGFTRRRCGRGTSRRAAPAQTPPYRTRHDLSLHQEANAGEGPGALVCCRVYGST